MLRIAAAEDLTALTRLRRAATGDSAEDAAGWLQRVAGLENILLLEKPGAPPALMLAAVPVHYAHRKGIWFTGLAADKGVPADKLLPKLLEGALRAFAENGCDFAVMTPDTAADASHLADLGFKNLLPLRVVSKPIRRNLLAQAQFDSLTVRHLMERRLRCQPGERGALNGLIQVCGEEGKVHASLGFRADGHLLLEPGQLLDDPPGLLLRLMLGSLWQDLGGSEGQR